jgi:hypothetical protein
VSRRRRRQMLTITVANYSRKHGDIETIIITDEVLDKIKEQYT